MTRFARAQGSKSSNERTPHEATAWTDMKQQFASKKGEIDHNKRKDFLELREKNYKDFLIEHSAKQTNTWADFSDVTEPNNAPLNKNKIKSNDNIGNNKNDDNNMKKNQRNSKLQKNLDIPVTDIKPRKNKMKVVKVESTEEDNKSTRKMKKCKIVEPENVEECPARSTLVQKVEKIFANDNEQLLYEKKLARRARQKEKVMLRKAILIANEDNRLTQVIKEKVAKIKDRRLQKVLARKAERESLKGTSETTAISNENGCTENTSKKKRKKRKKNSSATNFNADKVKEIPENVNIFNKMDDSVEVKIGKKDKLMQKRNVSENECETEVNENMSDQKKKKRNRNLTKTINSEATNEIRTEDVSDKMNKKKKNCKNINSLSDDNSNGQHKQDNNNFCENKSNFKAAQQNNASTKQYKLKNSKWTGEHRKKVLETTTLRLNGRSIEIALFDGFPVKKDDYERLAQLRKEMFSKGVPRSEVQRAMQLERRRAEKALAREKKEVCFHCRKAGHKLTECPKAMVQETEATGICFKCGSTEHTHFACKVVQQQQFKFATCFICREPGHIAKQCPQNEHGIYPQGGCCNVCGDVTHLKKDCPQYQAQQEHNAIQLDTIDGANLEALEKSEVNVKAIARPVKKAKVVKF